MFIDNYALSVLLDSGSSGSFINEESANKLKLNTTATSQPIAMDLTTMNTEVV